MSDGHQIEQSRNNRSSGTPLDEIVKALRGLKYGYVQIVVQDSRVVQIERTEKVRLDRPADFVAPGGDTI